MSGRPDILCISLGTTKGLRVADEGFAELLREAGATVAIAATGIGATNRLRRGYPVNDIVEAIAGRRAAASAIAREQPRAVVFSTTTATLLMAPLTVPFAIRFDAPAALNRPGARNAVLHKLERRRMEQATLLLPTSRAAVAPLAVSTPSVIVPFPIRASIPYAAASAEALPRERVAVAYTPDPKAKGLDLLCAAWSDAGIADARLDVYGIPAEVARAFLRRRGVPEPAGVRLRGLVPVAEFRAALRSALVFVSAARWEDFGQAALEAMADGAVPVCAPAGGPFEALEVTRALDPALVATDLAPPALARALRHAFSLDPHRLATLRAAAEAAAAAYAPEQFVDRLAADVLPRLVR
ncbi:MAG TPA: glycosyltransferase [Conexibacter sp.]